MDSNKFALSVVTFYICETGIGSYDFKINLFIQTPLTVVQAYFMAKIEQQQ